MNGYEIARGLYDNRRRLEELLEETFGEVTQAVESVLDDIDKGVKSGQQKIEAYAYVISKLEEERVPFESLKKHHNDLAGKYRDKGKSIDRNISNLKERAILLMEQMNVTRVETDRGAIYIQDHESVEISELSEDEKNWLVDNGYAEWELKINKRAIMNDLKAEEESDLSLLPIDKKITKSLRKP